MISIFSKWAYIEPLHCHNNPCLFMRKLTWLKHLHQINSATCIWTWLYCWCCQLFSVSVKLLPMPSMPFMSLKICSVYCQHSHLMDISPRVATCLKVGSTQQMHVYNFVVSSCFVMMMLHACGLPYALIGLELHMDTSNIPPLTNQCSGLCGRPCVPILPTPQKNQT